MAGSAKLSIPKPEFYVVYTGTDKKDVNEFYSLADEFWDGDDSFINVKIKVLQADTNRNDIVTQYILFTRILAEQEKQYGRTEKAITETIRICKDQDVLKEYLEKKEQEVITIMKSLFSQEDAVKEYGDEQKIRGAIAAWKDVGLSEEEIIKRAAVKFNVTEDYVKSLLHTAA